MDKGVHKKKHSVVEVKMESLSIGPIYNKLVEIMVGVNFFKSGERNAPNSIISKKKSKIFFKRSQVR